MSSQNPWSEHEVLWKGAPNFHAEVVGTAGICWIYCLMFTIVKFVYNWFFHRDNVIYVLKAFLTLIPIFAVIAVVASYWRHSHQYVITPAHIHIKKRKTWQSFHLENVLSVEVKKHFFIQLFGTFLEIRADSSDLKKPVRSKKYIRLHHVESLYMVKDLIEHAAKSVKTAYPDQS